MIRISILTALFLLPGFQVGCGRKVPVDEVSLSQSGVEVSEIDLAVDPSDWPSWRGMSRDGIAPAQDVPTVWGDKQNIRWKADVPGRGHSSPIVVGETVYLATAIETEQQQRVIAFNREDGSVRWNSIVHEGSFPAAKEVHAKATNANGTIASDGRQLYLAMFNDDAIWATAFDLDGTVVWQKRIGGFVSRFGYAPSPLVYQSLVIFAADHSGGGYIAALDAKSGDVAWRIKRNDVDSYSSPTIANVGSRDQLLISGDKAVTSYDPKSGKQLWRTPCIAAATCGTIVTSGDRIYASGGFPDNETVCLSADGDRIWSDDTRVYEPSLLAFNEYLFTVDDDGIAHCWDAASGDKHWKKRLGGNVSASPIAVGEIIFCPNLEGTTHVIRIGNEFESIAKNRLGNDSYSSMAVSRGEIFMRIGVDDSNGRREQLVCIASMPSDEIRQTRHDTIPPATMGALVGN